MVYVRLSQNSRLACRFEVGARVTRGRTIRERECATLNTKLYNFQSFCCVIMIAHFWRSVIDCAIQCSKCENEQMLLVCFSSLLGYKINKTHTILDFLFWFCTHQCSKTQPDNKRWVSLSEIHFCCKTKWYKFFFSLGHVPMRPLTTSSKYLCIYTACHMNAGFDYMLFMLLLCRLLFFFSFIRSVSLSHSVSPGSLIRSFAQLCFYLLYTWTHCWRIVVFACSCMCAQEREKWREQHTRQREKHSEWVKKNWWR